MSEEWRVELRGVCALAADRQGGQVLATCADRFVRLDARTGVILEQHEVSPGEDSAVPADGGFAEPRLAAGQIAASGVAIGTVRAVASQDGSEHADLVVMAPGAPARRIDVRDLEPAAEADVLWDAAWALSDDGRFLAYAWETDDRSRIVLRALPSLERVAERRRAPASCDALAIEGDTPHLAAAFEDKLYLWGATRRAKTWTSYEGVAALAFDQARSGLYATSTRRRACWVLSSRPTYGVELPHEHGRARCLFIDVAAETITWLDEPRVLIEQRLRDGAIRRSATLAGLAGLAHDSIVACGHGAVVGIHEGDGVARRALRPTWSPWIDLG